MKPKAVLFDLDDTLIHRKESILKYTIRFHEKFRANLQPIDFSELTRLMLEIDDGGYRPRTDFFTQLLHELEWKNPPDICKLNSHWYENFPSCSVSCPGLYETLDFLKSLKLRLGIITNGSSLAQNAKIELLGIRPLLDVVIISEEASIRKPDSGIFEMAVNQLETTPEEAWFVGDNIQSDMLGSMSIGMPAVWMRNCREWPNEHERPVHEIDSLIEVIRLVVEAIQCSN